ncbi:hypothetical protein VOLCADRAFT_100994 [Volvox carteri f. nagariensis]|uniref:Uncharacterized protein n=1 Tax=Volvox carteri f. nagariensis TaxID=3068 RepID=D8ULH6_VOLCA|nr:uncharacterized protein VOLCADRAFT_100994 [Volvox carteri f. nagariensis]EFJ39423.1 hypothetical protein VOLCADRAFT_100994 [Volvox carteri f. nagariensis]|eukprot:XP_002959512.1 hypothetical protein VOLCADRAFT_100994 [Volvox carteri f. nagariensis]
MLIRPWGWRGGGSGGPRPINLSEEEEKAAMYHRQRLMRTVGSSRCSFRAAAFLALFAFQGLGWWAGQAYGGLGGSSGGNGTEQMGPEQRSKAESFGKAFEDYVVLGQDPVAIALRRLSITAIDAFETAVQNQIARAIRNIDAELERYEEYVGRVAEALTDGNVDNLVAALEREVRVLVIVRACLEDIGARMESYVAFLTGAASSWLSYYYGYQVRFTVMLIALLSSNDPLGLEYVRVLYSLADMTRLVGLVLKPFIRLQKFEQSFYNALNDILFTYANDERNRFTITPSFSFEASLGTSGNLQAAMDRVLSLAQALGNRENAAALLRSATTARDQVIAALRRPHADGSSNVGGLFMQQSWQDEDMDGDGEPQGLGVAARLARMQGLASGAANANFFSAASG